MTTLVSSIAGAFSGGGAAGLSSGAMGLASQGSLISGNVFASGAGSLMSAVSTGLTLASAATSLFQGNQQAAAVPMQVMPEARALTFESEQDEMEARQIEIDAQRESNDLMERLNRTLAGQRLAFSANGVDPSFGTPVSVAENSRKEANLQASRTREDAKLRALTRRRQAQERLIERGSLFTAAESRMGSLRTGGYVKAAGTVADLIDRRAGRG